MKRLFIDMDGTLARFYDQARCVEKMYEPAFFRNLLPYGSTVRAVKLLSERDDIQVAILSAVDGEEARADKRDWVDTNIGSGIPCMFCAAGQPKAEFVRVSKGGISADDYLLDDYSRNLVEWESAGGCGIKFINELNGRGWNGHNYGGGRVYYDQAPEDMARTVLMEMGILTDNRGKAPLSEADFLKAVDEIMTGQLGWTKDHSVWQTDLYASYDEMLSDRDLKDIFSCSDPYGRFFELMDEWYGWEEYECRDNLYSKLRQKLSERKGAFAADSEGAFLNQDVEEMFQRIVEDGTFAVNYPYRHYLDQKIKVNIMIDTGDANKDFTDNTVYPHWGCAPGRISPKASIVWLSRTQGYRKKKLEKSLFSYKDALNKQGFLPTLGQELVNMPSQISILTFLVEMTLEQALDLALTMRGVQCLKTAGNSTLKISKDTVCGLFDPSDGGGSLFEIELRKDLYIPVKYIWTAKPDGCVGQYSIKECYGMCGSAWRDSLLEINIKEGA